MEACRACLATEETMRPMDETFVNAYNILTNLNVALSDSMPQYVCQSCLQCVVLYMEFRQKCITTETSLREVLLKDFNFEEEKLPHKSNSEVKVKVERDIKEEEEQSCEGFLFDNIFDENEPGVNLIMKEEDSLFVEGLTLKQKKKKHKKKKNKEKVKHNVKVIKHEIDEDIKLSCGLCKLTFIEKQELSNHIESHKEDRRCGLCPEAVQTFPALVGHRMTHIPRCQQKCHMCKRKGYSCVQMEYHYMHTHYDGEKTRLKCKQCPRSYETPKQLKKHISSTHTRVMTLICDYCSKICPTKSILVSHIRTHMDIRSFVCDECGFSSNHSGGLKDHKIRKHIKTKVICKPCGKPFACEGDKEKHKCNKKTNICPVCGIQISTTKNLSRHLWIHSSVGRYSCTRCPAVYKTKGGLKAHINRHDGIRPIQCEYCPQRFYTASVLIKHRRIHTGEKPYVCKICTKAFTGNYNLKVHMKVHGQNLVVKRNKPEDMVCTVPIIYVGKE